MARNEILDELHATRAKLLQQSSGDKRRYFREATERLKASVRGRGIEFAPVAFLFGTGCAGGPYSLACAAG
jgi:hypothetical protein